MALVTIDDCKGYVRVQTAAEDAQFTRWLDGAVGSVQSYLRRPILAEARTFHFPRDWYPYGHVAADFGGRLWWGREARIILPVYPVADDVIGSDGIVPPVITDGDAETVDDATYRVDGRTGVIDAISPDYFGTPPYVVVAWVGLEVHPDYAAVIEPVLNAAILDLVADRWARRNPAATDDATGGGVSTSYPAHTGIPARIRETLDAWRMVRAR